MGIDTVALMSTLMRIGQLLLALSLLVFIHELGHFLFARLFGVRVDKFYLFFDVKGKALWRIVLRVARRSMVSAGSRSGATARSMG